MEFFDSHCHYNDEKFDLDREEIMRQTYQEGITKLICAGYDIASSQKAVKIAKEHDFIYAIVGISPNDIKEEKSTFLEQLTLLERLVQEEKKIVAIGEIGLDYYWNKENKEFQKEAFAMQIELANKLNLPIVIHSRDAYQDTIAVLKNILPNKRGVFHCCQLNRELVREALELGFYISFAGPITFKNAKNAQEIIEMVPIEKMLIETDSPYLSPEPKRGSRNYAGNVKYVAEKIALWKQAPLDKIAKRTYENANTIFSI